jgi:hypothetical protein
MINVKNKTCLNENCLIRPTYGLKEKKAQYCLKHKTLEMCF